MIYSFVLSCFWYSSGIKNEWPTEAQSCSMQSLLLNIKTLYHVFNGYFMSLVFESWTKLLHDEGNFAKMHLATNSSSPLMELKFPCHALHLMSLLDYKSITNHLTVLNLSMMYNSLHAFNAPYVVFRWSHNIYQMINKNIKNCSHKDIVGTMESSLVFVIDIFL